MPIFRPAAFAASDNVIILEIFEAKIAQTTKPFLLLFTIFFRFFIQI